MLGLGLTRDEVDEILNRQAGMLALSGTTGDVQRLLEQETRDPRAAEALELFCYQGRKFAGALVAVLGGLDCLVFTGGIGEHAPSIRARVCAGLEFLGIHLDPTRNAAAENGTVISPTSAPVAVYVLRSNEDRMIALHTREVLREAGGAR